MEDKKWTIFEEWKNTINKEIDKTESIGDLRDCLKEGF